MYVSQERSSVYANINENGVDILNTIASIISDLPAVNLIVADDLNARVKVLKGYWKKC